MLVWVVQNHRDHLSNYKMPESTGSKYAHEFYKDRNAATRQAAKNILALTLELLPPIKSAVDVGCGVGTWLAEINARGIDQIQGYDGSWVSEELLEIPSENFSECNLESPIVSERKFDLAISLEVAEHLPEECADTFVKSLVGLSDFVLFSAAIPHQGGVNHVNEQWQSYWAEKFSEHGYVTTDPIRPKVWSNEDISIPYRQNILLYVKDSRLNELDLDSCSIDSISKAHPELHMILNSKSVARSLQDLRMTLMKKLFGQ